MKVSISVGGRFHAFNLALILQEKGYLNELITSYPVFEAVKFGLDRKKVKSFIFKEIIERLFRRFLRREFPKPVSANLFDLFASFRFDYTSDVYIIWSSYALYSIRKIRKKNPQAVIILERGSSHIFVQNQLLVESGIKNPVYPSIIKKETDEYHMSDFIALPGRFAKRSFIEQGIPAEKLVINPYGVDLSKFPYGQKSESGVFTIGYVGSMSGRKNVKGLILACKKLVDLGFKLELLLIGGIDHGSFKKDDLFRESWISYKGPKPQAVLPFYYHQMDLFVLNSIEDGFGMVILQALSCGVPVIGTENTGALDAIKNNWNGFVIPIHDDESLSHKILDLMNNPKLLLEMKLHARQSVETGFSWSDYGNRYLQFLDQLQKNKMEPHS